VLAGQVSHAGLFAALARLVCLVAAQRAVQGTGHGVRAGGALAL
jgi:hypothetical protein